MDGLLSCSWHNEINFLFVIAEMVTDIDFTSIIAGKRSIFDKICFGMLNIDAIWIVDSTISFNNGCNNSTILFTELGSPISDVSETLESESLSLDSKRSSIALIHE